MDTQGQSTRNIPRPRDLCKAWRQGRCRYGDNCKFRHEIDETIIANNDAKAPQADSHENGSNTGTVGVAGPGPSKRSTTGGQTFRDTVSNFPVNSVTCKDWKSGKCFRGESCRFSHGDEAGHTPEQTRFKRRDKRQIKGKEKEEQDPEMSMIVAEMRTRAERQAKQEKNKKAENEKTEEIVKQRAEEESKRLEEETRQRERARAEFLLHGKERRAEEERRRNMERLAREEAAREASRIQQIELQNRRAQEATVVEQYLVFGSSLVTCTAGMDISCVVPGFELCSITIKNLPRDAKPEEIKDIFIQQGLKPSDFFLSNTKNNLNRLEATVLVNAEYGHLIAMGLEGIPFRDDPLTFILNGSGNATSMDPSTRNEPFLMVSWRAPSDTVIATYSTMEEAQCSMRKLNGTSWQGRQIRVTMNEPPQGKTIRFFNPASVKLMNLPPNGYIDPELYGFTGSMNLRLLKSPRYDLEESLRAVKAHLHGIRGVRMDTYEVLTNGHEENAEIKIKVLFNNWESAQEAHASIGAIRGGPSSPNFRPWIPPKPLRYTIRIPKQQYDAQRKQWDAISQKTPGSGVYVQCKVGNRGDVVFVDVLGQDKEALGPLKVRVENLVSGEKLGPGFWHQSMASNSAKILFNRIYQETKVCVRNDFKTRSLRAYGEPDNVLEARRMIKAEIDRLAQMETTRILDRGSVRFFVKEGLGKLAELLGEENVNLNLASRPCRITVKGGEEAIHHLQRILEESRRTVFHDSALTENAEKDTCPICMDETSHPETLVCGHTYCGGCIKHFLISATDTKIFPLVCIGNDATCKSPIAIPFIRRFLPESLFQVLVETVFISYVDEHPQDLRYCTTPDCKQIYRRNTQKSTLECPSCFSNICPACGEEAHENMTCDERRIHKDPALQERLNEELASASGFKKCPQCNIWIEKTEGCNHMTCKCGAHICWRCMAISDHNGPFDGGSIYRHMEAAHGNIFDDIPPEIDDPPARNHAHVPVPPAVNMLYNQPRIPPVYQYQGDPLERYLFQNVGGAQEERRRELERENERVTQAQRVREAFEHLRIAQLEERMRRDRVLEERARAEAARQREDRGWCTIM